MTTKKLMMSVMACAGLSGFAAPDWAVMVDPNEEVGAIKIMNAVNNGPTKPRTDQSRGNFEEYAALKIPYARTHDAAHCHSYGGPHTVDISAIFPNWDADETKAENYDFTLTDAYLSNIRAAGTEPYFRLGQSIEHYIKKYHVRPPKDFAKWARICEHIVRHYNEGWANGFKWNIQYWEIWNEPNQLGSAASATWTGTMEQFFELYKVTSLHLRKCFGETIKIGGPSMINWHGNGWKEHFLPFCAKEKLPLDFYSWHRYVTNPRFLGRDARSAREFLDKHGFTKTENHLNEWNYVKGWGDEWIYSLECMSGRFSEKGAALIAAVMIDCQDTPLDMLMFYDARIGSGMNNMFDRLSLRPTKGYYPFLAWRRLRDLGTQVKTTIDERPGSDQLYACAAKNSTGKNALFLARYSDDNNIVETRRVTISLPKNIKTDWTNARCYVTDVDFTYTETPLIINEDGTASVKMQPNSFVLIEFECATNATSTCKSPWEASQWITSAEAPIATDLDRKEQRAASGTSWFVGEVENADKVKSATWMTTGLGVYEIYVNGLRVGTDILKPGYTHFKKTRRSFSYDVTSLMKGAKGAKNIFAAEVSSGWWRDKIVNHVGRKSAFRGVLKIVYADGTTKLYGTSPETWKAGIAGRVKHAGIFDGEEYDAREIDPLFGSSALKPAVVSDEFKGEILPSEGGEVRHRYDLALKPVAAYCWKGVTGANDKKELEQVFGTVVKTRTFAPGGKFSVAPGETLVVDFGQNCAAVPAFRFKAKRGTVLTCLPGEMLNDENGERERGNDGPGGSVYRENLRVASKILYIDYTFAGDGIETYLPRFTFFGYRYISVTATDDVEIESVMSIPVSSITKAMELGSITTGDKDVNQLISNVYWGQLSNYLSVPTDCPQRTERLGWTADTQVFSEAGAFNANTTSFFHKWMRDVVDSQNEDGGFAGVAPFGQYGNGIFWFGWADAGVIVPWTIWKQFNDKEIIEENWDAMAKFVRKICEKKYDFENPPNTRSNPADWLSYETFESSGNQYGNYWETWKDHPDAMNYRRFLAACYWYYDSLLMAQMADAIGKTAEKDEFTASAKQAMAYMRGRFLEKDGLLLKPMRHLQTASIFALKFGVVEGKAFDETKALLLKSIKDHGDSLQTGFLGTSFIMDTLTEIGCVDVAYTLLLQHKCPSWLCSVDQGATTIWERWNSYTKKDGFGPSGMNSFNHYAYGAVLAWIYKTAAGIAATPDDPGFKTIIMAPKPDKRLGSVSATYKAPTGIIRSAWHYEGDTWIWNFTIPEGAKGLVTVPGKKPAEYAPGTYCITARQ